MSVGAPGGIQGTAQGCSAGEWQGLREGRGDQDAFRREKLLAVVAAHILGHIRRAMQIVVDGRAHH